MEIIEFIHSDNYKVISFCTFSELSQLKSDYKSQKEVVIPLSFGSYGVIENLQAQACSTTMVKCYITYQKIYSQEIKD